MIPTFWIKVLFVLGLVFGAAWFVAKFNEMDIHPLRQLAAASRRPAWELALLAIIVTGFIHHGATKGTNGVPDRAGGGMESISPPIPQSSNPPLPQFPAGGAVTNTDWLAFGGYEDWFHIPDGDWCFRFGSNLTERLTVFAFGEVRTSPHDVSNRISLLGLPLSIVPAANWHLIPQPPTLTPQQSLFWHAITSSNSLLLTWRNALVNRDTNQPVTVQAELFPDGAAALRYDFSGLGGGMATLSNAAARIWRDGAVDEVPLLAGTVAAVEFPAPPVMDTNALNEVYARITGGDSNAYYFAEAVVGKGPARIDVEADGDSALGGYRLMAEPGVTNRLPLLIGPRYAVSSEVAFSHFALVPSELQTMESHPSATNVTDRLVEVRWPVEFGLDEVSASPAETIYALHVVPDFLCGTVSWSGAATNGPMRGTPPLRSGGDGCTCGCQSHSTNTVSHASSCSCGECSASGDYGYEGHSEHFELPFPDAAGSDPPDPPNPGGDPDPPDPPGSSVSVNTEKTLIFFEDTYENGPGESVPRRSTFCKIECEYNVIEAGMLMLRIVNGGNKIILHEGSTSGQEVGGLRTWLLNANCSGKYVFYAEGTAASDTMSDVQFELSFIPDDDPSLQCEKTAQITVIEFKTTSVVAYPPQYRQRHVFGVCEKVKCEILPNSPSVDWGLSGDGRWVDVTMFDRKCLMPTSSGMVNVTLSGGNETFATGLSCVSPTGISATVISCIAATNLPNQAGAIGMNLQFALMPTNVSFFGLLVEEKPSTQGDHVGYFNSNSWSNFWYHGTEQGAGSWGVATYNNVYSTDNAYIGLCPQPWITGLLSWVIPSEWTPPSDYTPLIDPITFYECTQNMSITADGTVSVSKHGNTAVRTTNNWITVNGVRVL